MSYESPSLKNKPTDDFDDTVMFKVMKSVKSGRKLEENPNSGSD